MTSLCYKIVFGIVSISKHDVFRLRALETIHTNEGPSCICVPNLKRIYSSVREIMTGPKLNCEIGSRDLCLPTYGRICAPQVKLPRLDVCVLGLNLKSVALSVCEILRVPKISKLVTSPRPRLLRGQFVIRWHQWPTLHLYGISNLNFIHSLAIEGVPRFRN